MIAEKLEKIYGQDTPIFTDEIIRLFEGYTRAYVFRLINKAKKDNTLIEFSRGVYYVPRDTILGKSTICTEIVAEKKYISDKNSVYGIYSGLTLLNSFGITTQMPNTLEIVTNNETTRKRMVEIEGRNIILRMSRCDITKENYAVYTILQLFTDMRKSDKIDDTSKKRIEEYIEKNKVTLEKLFFMASYFPSVTIKKLMCNGILDFITK